MSYSPNSFLIMGRPKLGKTLLAVKLAWIHYLLGFKVISNIHIDFQSYYVENAYQLKKVIEDELKKNPKAKFFVLIDEIGLSGGRFNIHSPYLIKFFAQQRKTIKSKSYLVCTCQFEKQNTSTITAIFDAYAYPYIKKKEVVGEEIPLVGKLTIYLRSEDGGEFDKKITNSYTVYDVIDKYDTHEEAKAFTALNFYDAYETYFQEIQSVAKMDKITKDSWVSRISEEFNTSKVDALQWLSRIYTDNVDKKIKKEILDRIRANAVSAV